MPNILVGQLFAFKNMTQVTIAMLANDFDSPAIHIGLPFDGAWNLIVEGGPPTTGVKFVAGLIEG